MATQLSKADRIRKMLHLSNKDIAEIIGCHEAYVRVVRQRTSPSGNPVTNEAAKNWAASNHGRVLAAAARRFRERYHNDPGYRAKHIAGTRLVTETATALTRNFGSALRPIGARGITRTTRSPARHDIQRRTGQAAPSPQ